MLLSQLAEALQLQVQGDAELDIESLAPVAEATENQLTFVVGPKYRKQLRSTRASAVIATAELAVDAPCSILVSTSPYLDYARASQLLYPRAAVTPGIAGSAVIDSTAKIASSASIAEQCFVGAGAVIGDGVSLGMGCRVGANVQIDAGSVLVGNVWVDDECTIGRRCRIQPGTVIGSDGFGYAPGPDGWVGIRQVGRVVIGDDVEIGANTTIDRGALSDTVIGNGVILDNQIQIAHNVVIGDHTAIAACVGIAGSTRIGKRCLIGGKSAIVGHIEITDDVQLHATSFVTRSILESGSYSSGSPLLKTSKWRRLYLQLARFDELIKARR